MRSSLLVLTFLAAGSALAQQSEPPAAQQPYSVVEPKAPPKAKPAVRKRAAKANAKAKAAARAKPGAKPSVMAQAEPPKRTGPCVIKPVMTDQDLINCGATPQH